MELEEELRKLRSMEKDLLNSISHSEKENEQVLNTIKELQTNITKNHENVAFLRKEAQIVDLDEYRIIKEELIAWSISITEYLNLVNNSKVVLKAMKMNLNAVQEAIKDIESDSTHEAEIFEFKCTKK